MSQTTTQVARGRLQLDYLPISLFGSVMGLTGLSVAWRLAQARYGDPAWLAPVAPAIGIIAVVAFVAILAAYAIKVLTAFDTVRTEFRDPIAGSLFGTAIISLLLLPIVLAPYNLILAQALWIAGAIGMILFAWLIVGRWMSDRQQVAHATPAWVIPVVGLLNVPLAMPVLGLPPMHGLMVFALATGLFFAVPLFTLIFSRLLFEPPLPDALKPSLLILIAPFAVGCSTYTVTTGRADMFAAGALHADAVRSGRVARPAAPPAGLLSIPHLLVGRELSARRVRHRWLALRRCRTRFHSGFDRVGAPGPGDAGRRRTVRSHAARPGQGRVADAERLTNAAATVSVAPAAFAIVQNGRCR